MVNSLQCAVSLSPTCKSLVVNISTQWHLRGVEGHVAKVGQGGGQLDEEVTGEDPHHDPIPSFSQMLTFLFHFTAVQSFGKSNNHDFAHITSGGFSLPVSFI